MKKIIFALILIATNQYAIAVNSIEQQVEDFLNDLNPVYKVKAPNETLLNKALVSFHAELLEAERDNLTITFSLNPEQVKQLEGFGFSVEALPNWKKSWKHQWQSKQQPQLKNQIKMPGISGYECYSTVEETFSKAQQLSQTYSGIAQWIDIGDSWEKTAGMGGHDLMVLKITNRSIGKQKPKLFIHSAMHAREYTTAALTLDYAIQLVEGYETNADYQWIIDHHEIHLLFMMNPDGRKKAEQGILWRKNTNQNHCSATSNNRGADLNRNFSWFWNTTANGSSGNACDATYRGPSKASEPETQAVEAYIKSIFPDQRGPGINDAAPAFTKGMHIDVHSFSELVLWPWGHTAVEAPNANELKTLGHKLAYWNNYNPIQSVGLYPTDGTSDDISYGELGIPHYTFELGTEFFQDCATYANTIKPNNLPALVYAAKVVEAPYRLPFGPDIEGVTLNGAVNAQVAAGETVAIAGNANDGRFKDANGVTIPRQNIKVVSYFIDELPWDNSASATILNAADGTFDNDLEAFNGSIDTSALSAGKHLVYFQAEDTDGNKGAPYAAFLTIGTNQAPNAAFSVDCQGLSCTFDASTSTDDGSIQQYSWDIDGTAASGLMTSYSFTEEKAYNVNLTVTDNGSLSNSSSQLVDTNQAPSVDFSVSCNNLSCSFDASASSDLVGDIASYQWDFGDGSQATGETANRTFAQAATYNVKLVVTDDEGDTAELTKTATATSANPPTAEPTSGGGGGTFGWWILSLLLGGALIRKQRL